MLSPRRSLLVALASLHVVGCKEVSATNSTNYRFEEIASYGWVSLEDSPTPLSDRERTAGAGVLERIGGLAETPDGSIAVIDRSYQKIAVFDRDGPFSRVILGGYGRSASCSGTCHPYSCSGLVCDEIGSLSWCVRCRDAE